MLDVLETVDQHTGPQMSGTRRRLYERLTNDTLRNSLFAPEGLAEAIETLSAYPLLEAARDTIARQIRVGIEDEDLAQLAVSLHEEDRFCAVKQTRADEEVHIVCSLGTFLPAAQTETHA